MEKRPLTRIGWREWVALPDLDVRWIKAKVDTGARTSALHAVGVERFQRRGKSMVRFTVHPDQRSQARTVTVEAEVIDERAVKSSTGHVSTRPVIRTPFRLLDEERLIEVTLVSRTEMGFRMLLGREALRKRFLVDSGASFLGGRPPKRKKKKKKKKAAAKKKRKKKRNEPS